MVQVRFKLDIALFDRQIVFSYSFTRYSLYALLPRLVPSVAARCAPPLCARLATVEGRPREAAHAGPLSQLQLAEGLLGGGLDHVT